MTTPLRVSVDPVREAFERLRAAHRAAPYPTAAERRDRLDRLDKLIVRNRNALCEAIDADFGGRSRHESLLADVMSTAESVRHARRKLANWMEPRPAATNPYFVPSRTFVEHLPLGVVGIISPWNYPVNLALAPLACVLAAGNRALIKPSELTPRTSRLLAELVAEHFTSEEVAVVEGGPDVARAVTELPLDHLVFTGSTHVGRQVASAAAQNLVPTTLELGGKSPALVHPEYDIRKAAERIALGKLFNAGQTCIAPDYALIPEGKEAAFAQAFRETCSRAQPGLPHNPQYTSVLSVRHWERLNALLEEARERGARLETTGGEPDAGKRRMAPVLVFDAHEGTRLMQEEIFGPILPVRSYRTLEGALAEIAARPRPLAFYYFDEDLDRARGILKRTLSGGACLNDTLVHFVQEELPFGGVGASGMGAYHGRAGFEAFSHARGVLVASPLSVARRLQAPPYGRVLERALDVILDRTDKLPGIGVLRGLLGR